MTIRQPGIKQRNNGIWVIDAAPCPAVLLECGFISNAKDVAFLTNEKNQEKIAVAVLKGIVKYAENLAATTVNVEGTNPVLDTLPGHTDTYVMTADSRTFKQLSGTNKLIIVNGKKRTKSWWDYHIISAKKVTVIKENDTAAIKQYGPEAKNGVMIFEGAIISDKNNAGNGQSKIQKVFTKAEVMPKFHDGENGWNRYSSKFLSENLQSLIADGKEGVCEIAFIVDTEGFISDLTVKTMQNTKLANVFLEALMKGPKWTPAIQNGRKVVCWQSQKLTFRLPKSNDGQSVAVANAYFPTLYLGIENPLLISGVDVSPEKINVTSSNGKVSYMNNTWIVKPSSLSEAIITVTDLNENRKSEFVFSVKQMPDPAVTFGNSKGGRVATYKILQSKNLMIEEDWELINFTMYLTGKGFDKPLVFPANKSAEFDQKILDVIAKCGPGTTIVIDEIHAKFKKTGLEKTLPTLAYNLY